MFNHFVYTFRCLLILNMEYSFGKLSSDHLLTSECQYIIQHDKLVCIRGFSHPPVIYPLRDGFYAKCALDAK